VPLEDILYNLTCESQGGHPFATISWFRGVEKVFKIFYNFKKLRGP